MSSTSTVQTVCKVRPTGRFTLQYTADPRNDEGFDSYSAMLLRAHELIHAGVSHVTVLDSGDRLGVLTHKDFRSRCPKCDPALREAVG